MKVPGFTEAGVGKTAIQVQVPKYYGYNRGHFLFWTTAFQNTAYVKVMAVQLQTPITDAAREMHLSTGDNMIRRTAKSVSLR